MSCVRDEGTADVCCGERRYDALSAAEGRRRRITWRRDREGQSQQEGRGERVEMRRFGDGQDEVWIREQVWELEEVVVV